MKLLALVLATLALAGSARPHPRFPPVPKSKLFGRIAYSSRSGDIWVMNANGTCRHQVSHSGPDNDFDPSWSPEGKHLVFRTSRGHYLPDEYGNGLEGLFTIDVDGSNEHEIEPPTGGMFADWSPRGDKIAFSGLRAGHRYDTLFMMNPDGSGIHDLGTPFGSEGAVWSPDATRIEYGAHNGDGNWAIWTMNADGTDQRQLTHPPLVYPAGSGGDGPGPWSPNGRRIAYSHGRSSGREVWVMNADGTHQHPITHWRGSDSPAAWLPNGKAIRSLPLLNAAGSPIKWLPDAAPDPRCR